MEIRSMFQKPIERDIQGVIKVTQTDQENTLQELSEYVVTKELARHFSTFFQAYQKGISSYTDQMGVWISGFFGSGKSHFLKILSYLLENKQVGDRRAVDFFEDKISDPLVLANIKRAGEVPTDVMLFNIDSKSIYNTKNTKEAIIQVFYKVFYEMQGFYGDKPWIAEMESQLEREGLYPAFKATMKELTGIQWEEGRRRVLFDRDKVVEALVRVRGMSQESAKDWFNRGDENISLSVENFARSVKEYIDKKGNNHHVVFLVDEMGQYIGDNTQMMLNLQTVVEDLGAYCRGRAWVLVTSQEDIDSIVKMDVTGRDFSKIQGRFNTRLSLSSANVDEVIKRRLLEKTQVAHQTLDLLYRDKSAVLRNLITFSQGTAEMKNYADASDFSEVYPFVPYQFNLLQKVLTSIRQQGASGKHLSEGERSLLGAFQFAAKQYLASSLGALIPFACFYDSIEDFLESAVSRVIAQAKENSNLNSYDVEVLKLLFLIKHLKEMPAQVENLVTLMVTSIDEDKLALKKKIEQSLRKLVGETLVQKNGDFYIFLTDEEQNINREIKRVSIDPHTITSSVGELIFDEIYQNNRYQYNSEYSFSFNQRIDDRGRGVQDAQISINIITPYYDGYAELGDEDCKLKSFDGTSVIVKLPAADDFLEEIVDILKIETYITRNASARQAKHIIEIINGKMQELVGRKSRARTLLEASLSQADIYIKGEKREITTKLPKEKIERAFKILVEGIYSKLDYINKSIKTNSDLAQILTENKKEMVLGNQEINQLALDEVLAYIAQNDDRNFKTSMKMVINRFSAIPYGWKELDIAAVVASLFKAQEIKLQYCGEYLSAHQRELLGYLTKRTEVDKLIITKRIQLSPELISTARSIGRAVFGRASLPQDEDSLMLALKEEISLKLQLLAQHEVYYREVAYPGKRVLLKSRALLEKLLSQREPSSFYQLLGEKKEELSELLREFEDVEGFFKNQKRHFDDALRILALYQENEEYIAAKGEIAGIVKQIEQVVESPRPYSQITQLPGLREKFNERFILLLEKEAQPIKEGIEQDYQEICRLIDKYEFEASFADKLRAPFRDLLQRIETVDNFYKAVAMATQSRNLKQRSLDLINQQLAQEASDAFEEKPSAKRIKSIRLQDLIGSTVVIKNEADLDKFIVELATKLKAYYRDDVEIILS